MSPDAPPRLLPQSDEQAPEFANTRQACLACQRKKIRCDRRLPCAQCLRSAVQCVPTTRKPRQRRVGRRAVDSELRSRVSKLESLVKSLSSDPDRADVDADVDADADVDGDDDPIVDEAAASPGASHVPSPAAAKYLGNPFWFSLSEEVQALRDALEEESAEEEDDDDEELDVGASEAADGSLSVEHDFLICPPSSVFVVPGALPGPTLQYVRQLYDMFFDNVDPVFKVLHQPSVREMLENNAPYLGHAADSPANTALKAAMWFSAVVTIRESECFARFRMAKRDLLHLYRRHVDVALTQADLLDTDDLPTLQALVICTVASRLTAPTRKAWTITALAVRLAFGMGLHHEQRSDTPYMKETKRRLWHQVRTLDAFTAIERGTMPLVQEDSFDTPSPSNANDSDFDESSSCVPDRARSFSDMTFNFISLTVSLLNTRLLAPQTPAARTETWQQRLDLVLKFGRQLRGSYLQYCDLSIPFHRFIYAVGNSMTASSILRAVRPMHRHKASLPPRVDSPFVLQLAVNSLRESEATHQDPAAEGWRWIFLVQWHALAVALAGLCFIRDTELSSMAWVYVERSYERQRRYIAETTEGSTLWKPIEKLYRKAKAFRGEHAAAPSQRTTSSSPVSARMATPTHSYTLSDAAAHTSPGSFTAPVRSSESPAHQQPLLSTPVSTEMSMDVGEDPSHTSPMEVGGMTWQDWRLIMQDMSNMHGDEMHVAETTTTTDTTTSLTLDDMLGQLEWNPQWETRNMNQGFI